MTTPPNTPATTISPPPTTTAAEARLGSIRGDRPCLKCGFNLHGQTILREPHYSLLIVRCPECSTIASLQDYPVLGRWARRWGFLLAGAYIVLVVFLLLAGGVAAGAFTAVAAEQLRNNYCTHIATVHRKWFDSTQQATVLLQSANLTPVGSEATNTVAAVNNWGPFAVVNKAWWEETGRAEFRQWLTTRPFAFQPDDIAAYSVCLVASLLGGGVLAVLLPGLRRARLLLIPAILGGIAGLVMLASQLGWTPYTPGILPTYTPVSTLALQEMPPRFPIWVIGGITVTLAVGAFVGRPAARGLIRLLLTPRVASAFSFLWEADGRTFK